VDSLEAGVTKSRRIYAPDRCRHQQEAPRRVLATLAAFLHFLIVFLQRGWRCGGVYSFHALRRCWGVAGGR
jgi:hypothetical protein